MCRVIGVVPTPGRDRELTTIEALIGVNMLIDADTNPVVTSKELGQWADISRDTALDRLNELAETGYVGKKRIGARTLVFWITPAGRDRIDSLD
jgi:predicted transcriptional regulator